MSNSKKTSALASLAVAAALLATPATAADMWVKARPAAPAPAPTSVWDIAFGAALMSDYNFRGISQSDRGPSASAYFEGQVQINPMLQAYIGVGGVSVKLPSDPAAEFNFYGGFRASQGPFSVDIGALYYYYPKEIAPADSSFVEVYGKFGYEFNSAFSVGFNVYYAPDVLQLGGAGTFISGTAKLTAPSGMFRTPDLGAYLSGEVGHYFFENAVGPDYTTWNVGFGFTYKVLTLDLRYHDTDLSEQTCSAFTGDEGLGVGRSKWCSPAFIAKLSVDTSLNAIK